MFGLPRWHFLHVAPVEGMASRGQRDLLSNLPCLDIRRFGSRGSNWSVKREENESESARGKRMNRSECGEEGEDD